MEFEPIDKILSAPVDSKPEATLESALSGLDQLVQQQSSPGANKFTPDANRFTPDVNNPSFPGQPNQFAEGARINASELFDPEPTAQNLIDGGDALLQSLGAAAYKWLAFSKEDDRALKHLIVQMKNKKDVELDEKKKKLLLKYDDYKYYEDEILPLTEKEQSRLKKPLVELVKTWSFSMSPGGALALTGGLMLGSRITPLIGLRRDN